MAKPKSKSKPKPKSKPSAPKRTASARPAAAEVTMETISCPVPPKKPRHVVDVPSDAVVGTVLQCNRGHEVEVTSVDPPEVEG